jgi:hypothetical protein
MIQILIVSSCIEIFYIKNKEQIWLAQAPMPRPRVSDSPLPAITDPANGTRPASTPSTMHAPARLRGSRPLCRYALPGNDDISRATCSGRFIVGQSFARSRLHAKWPMPKGKLRHPQPMSAPPTRTDNVFTFNPTPPVSPVRLAIRSEDAFSTPRMSGLAWHGLACWRGSTWPVLLDNMPHAHPVSRLLQSPRDRQPGPVQTRTPWSPPPTPPTWMSCMSFAVDWIGLGAV